MRRINITCPACGSKAYLRPASVVYGDKAPDPDAKYYVCGRYTSMLLWFLAAGGDGHRLIFGGCDEVGAYMELTLWHNTAHAESFQFYLSDYPCPGYAE